MTGFDALIVIVMVLAGMYALGIGPSPGMRHLYRRLRLAGLLWAVALTVIAASRAFDFP